MPITHTPYTTTVHVSDLTDEHAEDLAVRWIVWLRDVRHKAENTLEQYTRILGFWLRFCDAQGIHPLRPTLTDLESFTKRIRPRTKRRPSASTQNSDIAALRGWYEWLTARGFIPVNPALDLQSVPAQDREAQPIEDEDWVRIWGADYPLRLRALLGMGYYCGLRMAEIGALTGSQVTETRLVRIPRKGGKVQTLHWTDMAEVIYYKLPHLLPSMDVLVTAMRHVHNHTAPDSKIIPWQRSKELGRWMTKQCKRLEVPHYTPHQMRHSTATNLLRAGVREHVVMELMAHDSFNTTMGYVRAGNRSLREWLDHQ